MKLVYIANVRLPSQKAHGIQIMEMCKAFSSLGLKVELAIRNSKTEIKENPFNFYNIPQTFDIKKLWCLDTVHYGKVGFIFESLTFCVSVVFSYFSSDAIFYTRDELVAFILKILGKKTIWEAHMGQTNFLIKRLISMNTKIVAISHALKRLYLGFGSKDQDILVAPDAVDVSRFDIDLSKDAARSQLNLPAQKKIVLYKGSLISWKGVGTLLKCASHIADSEIMIVIVGGTEDEVISLRKEFKNQENVLLTGHVPRSETPIYQKASDILVIPNSEKEDVSKLYTSPMKLFGYMASGVPIVASDLPSIKEVVDDSNAYFFTPDDPKSLAETIDEVFNNYEEARVRAKKALEEVRSHSWDNRARGIVSFIEN